MASHPAVRNSLTVKAHNRRMLLVTLLREQPISRVRLARLTGLSTTTVTNLIAELMAQGVVMAVGTDAEARGAGAGRPPQALALVPGSRYALGIHIGVRNVRIALCDLCAQIVDSVIHPVDPAACARKTLIRVSEHALDLLQRHALGPDTPTFAGIGVGASGLVDIAAGVNVLAPNLHWDHVPIRQLVAETTGACVTVDNNVRCMALAESLYGAGRHARALAFIYARIGVGAGLVVDGQIYRGAGYGAGEIGHWITIPNLEGPAISLEELISERQILARARRAARSPSDTDADGDQLPDIDAVLAAARSGDGTARAVLDDCGYYVGAALANLVDVLNPQLVLLGGFLHDGYDLLSSRIVETMRTYAFGGLGDKVELRPATFGRQCGEIGAATLGMDEFFFRMTA